MAVKRKAKRSKRGPVSDAEAIARVHALARAHPDDWADKARKALGELADFIVRKINLGELDPMIAIGAFRTLAQAVNVREAVVESPKPAEDLADSTKEES